MTEIVLTGTSSQTLADYLKALGIFRLVAEQMSRAGELRALWREGHLTFRWDDASDAAASDAELDATSLQRFFLHDYTPSPLLSPWSGRAGFLEGEDGEDSTRKGAQILRTVGVSKGVRFKAYRDLIDEVQRVPVIGEFDRCRSEIKALEALAKARKLDEAGRERLDAAKKRLKPLKDGLLVVLRSELGDAALAWLDACYVLGSEVTKPAPLLGSGGNEGSMDFSVNHVETLLALFDPDTDEPSEDAVALIGQALFGEVQPIASSSNIGFLSVAASGGVNMSQGFAGRPRENPWNAVLVMEGAVLFAAAATKKLESQERAGLSFPFMVEQTLAGEGSLGNSESARPEFWVPVWSGAASLMELKALLAEGRSTLGRRQARTGLDMLESLSELGISRGVSVFERFGFYERRGKGYFVGVHLGSYAAPREVRAGHLLRDLRQGGWLDRLSRFSKETESASRFSQLCRRLEDSLFALAVRDQGAAQMHGLLMHLADTQAALAGSAKARAEVGPVPRLSEEWVRAADDGSAEFRIAQALAGLQGVVDQPLPLRAQLFPVTRQGNEWITPSNSGSVRVHLGRRGRLVDVLGALLAQRLQLWRRLGMQDKPLASPAGATLDDVAAFLQDDRMDARIAALLPGLSLCHIPLGSDRSAGAGTLPAAFGLMKLALLPDAALRRLGRLGEDERLPVPASMLATLRAGDHGHRAVGMACRRLRASGLAPRMNVVEPTLTGVSPARAAAALLIPLRWGACAALARRLLDETADEADAATHCHAIEP